MYVQQLPSGRWRAQVKVNGRRVSITRPCEISARAAGREFEARRREARQAERDRVAGERQAERDRVAGERQAERDRVAGERQAERDRVAGEVAVRLPLGPLLALTRANHSQVAERVGTSRSAVVRAQQRGLSLYVADEWATACGFHPANVWPEYLAQISDGC